MKTLNTGSRVTSVSVKPVSEDSKMPCWYADFEKGEKRKDCVWKVGVKRDGEQNEEFTFKASKAGDTTDDAQWEQITSPDFAIKLLDKYKTGGQKAVKEWLKQGCP